MTINPKIKQKAEDIRRKTFGAEVRESLASGLEGMSEDVESIKGRQGSVENQFQDVLDETTGKDVISAPELIAARNGKSNLKTRLDDEHAQVTAQLQHMKIKVFNEVPSTSQLKEGEFGFVIDNKWLGYEDLNLSFEKLNSLGFPNTFSDTSTTVGNIINESYTDENTTDGGKRCQRLGMSNGSDGSNYTRLKHGVPIPLDNSRLITKGDLMNFRFSVKPVSSGCFVGSGSYFGLCEVVFRDKNNTPLNPKATIHYLYKNFTVPSTSIGRDIPMDEWTILHFDLYQFILSSTIDINDVESLSLTFLAYTNHSTTSIEYLVDDIRFGV